MHSRITYLLCPRLRRLSIVRICILTALSCQIQCATPAWGMLRVGETNEDYGAIATALTPHSKKGALKTAAGYRNRASGGLNNVGSNGNFWSFAPNSQTNARNLNFNSGNINPLNNNNRAYGFSVAGVRAFGWAQKICFSFMRYGYKDIHNLVVAAYLDARRHERNTLAQIEFEENLERNTVELATRLYDRSWKPLPMDWFVIDKPTIREVFAPRFKDRVVSHILFNQLSPIFERHFIYDSYSCRKGKGTLFGIERFEHHIRSVTENYTKEAYCLNLDISGYFMSINRSILYGIIWETLNKHLDEIDADFVDYLISIYLLREPTNGCRFVGNPALKGIVPPNKSLFGRPKGIGLPIGDVENQLNSNIYLNPYDHFILRDLKAKHYGRYVDDNKILRQDYNKLLEDKERCGEFLDKRLSLSLHPQKTTITSVYNTNHFLGATIEPFRKHARNDFFGRFSAYLNSLEERPDFNPEDELPMINARLGYLSHYNDRERTLRLLRKHRALLNPKFNFTQSLTKATVKLT